MPDIAGPCCGSSSDGIDSANEIKAKISRRPILENTLCEIFSGVAERDGQKSKSLLPSTDRPELRNRVHAG